MSATSTFSHVRTVDIALQQVSLQEYLHPQTGLRHYHFANDDNENAFLVCFLTPPADSTGVAHILEHLVLCGSKRFPVRDPFFLMLRRSLSTFMNALTAADWTAYPFATCNRRDFQNLLSVYLDATFFPNLDRRDFSQEGWRLDFADASDADAPLIYKGVVYNEMKGEMSSAMRQLWHRLCHHLFPSTTYRHNSGGDPSQIPELTWEFLVDFHRRHYTPANAIVFTYGDMDPVEHQRMLQEQVLSTFDAADANGAGTVGSEVAITDPLSVTEKYRADHRAGEPEDHFLMGWLLGDSFDIAQQLRMRFLSHLLLDNSSCPLLHALETTPLAQAPSSIIGLDIDMRQMVFCVGAEDIDPNDADKIERLILDTIEQVARDGVAPALIEATLHQLELSQRDLGSGRFPRGLSLILSSLSGALHGDDIVSLLDIDSHLKQLRKDVTETDIVRDLARELLDTPHRVSLTFISDGELIEKDAAREKSILADRLQQMDTRAREELVAFNQEIAERQNQKDDADMLPKVTPADVSVDIAEPSATTTTEGYTGFAINANGLVYLRRFASFTVPSPECYRYLSAFADLLTEVGVGGQPYTEMQLRHSRYSGGVASSFLYDNVPHRSEPIAYWVMATKGLTDNFDRMRRLLEDTVQSARFDEDERIREQLAQWRLEAEHGVVAQGHRYAMLAASSAVSPLSYWNHRDSGLPEVQKLIQFHEQSDDDAWLGEFKQNMNRLREHLAGASVHWLVLSDAESLDGHLAQLGSAGGALEERAFLLDDVPEYQSPMKQAWLANATVNFCAAAYHTVNRWHVDAAALTVLAHVLRNGYLHTAIREQGGAYGSGVHYDLSTSAFCFFSYRDPNITETLAHFRQSIEWVVDSLDDAAYLDEAILNTISAIDKPSLPSTQAHNIFVNQLLGRGIDWRRDFRMRVLDVTIEDLRKAARNYLLPEEPDCAVVASPDREELLRDLGYDISRVGTL